MNAYQARVHEIGNAGKPRISLHGHPASEMVFQDKMNGDKIIAMLITFGCVAVVRYCKIRWVEVQLLIIGSSLQMELGNWFWLGVQVMVKVPQAIAFLEGKHSGQCLARLVLQALVSYRGLCLKMTKFFM